MANNLLSNPIIINTQMGSASFKNSLPSINQSPYLRIEKIYWFQPANVGDTFMIQDGAGAVLWQGYCEVANQSQLFDWSANPRIWRDFQVTNIISGQLEITLR